MLRNASKNIQKLHREKDKFFLSNCRILSLRSRCGGWGGRQEPLLFAAKMRNFQMLETCLEKVKLETGSRCD